MDIYDLMSIRVCTFFGTRDWNQYSFHFHFLLAVEIPNCTTHYFEGHRSLYSTNTKKASFIYTGGKEINGSNHFPSFFQHFQFHICSSID